MRWADYDSRTCSVARTVEVLGDRWTLLVLRDIFNGIRRFDELSGHLGIARDVLTKRLATLVDEGLIRRQPYQEPGSRTRYEYRLTDAGRDLRPVLLALIAWGDRYRAEPDGPPAQLFHAECGAPVRVEVRCEAGHEIGSRTRLAALPGPGSRPCTAA
jgi:DNA-binding HxlR family transcriptional regulator